ncbi:glycosyl hydrolase family 61-domain-containing protein [Panaeolus papilionaceus]|nr:glycosyl hydrolase family 61-domain-containing protein [Panaeolus papilionaceus]
MLLSTVSLALALCAQKVAAHGGVLSYKIGGQYYKGFAPYNSASGQVTIQRQWNTFDPIQDASASTVACNNDGSALPDSQQLTATVTAGSAITAYWNNPWPHPQGPVLTYLAQCPGSSCNGVNSRSLKWFKIQEAGLLSGTVGNGQWAAGQMINNNNSWTTTIPSSVPNGPYLLRFETIALHSLPAQIYPECAQIQITGGGSRAPLSGELVSFPGAYSNSDPGLSVDLYSNSAKTQTTYKIPGPPLYGSGSGTPQQPTTAPPSSTTNNGGGSQPTTTSTPGTVPQYGQCGGQGYTGPTGCVSPFKCVVSNPYYSQCL